MEQIKGQTSIDDFLGDLKPPKKKTPKPAKSEVTKETRKQSLEKTDKQTMKMRVLETLKGKELTAREVAIEMHKNKMLPYPARAIIQPRITELLAAGEIETTGAKLDTATQRKVAVYKVVEK